MSENSNKTTNRRWWTVVSFAGILTFLVIFGITRLGNGSGEDSIDSDVTFSDSEKVAIKKKSEEFIAQAGNFGIKDDVLTGDNIRNVSSLVSRQQPGYLDYFKTRTLGYNEVKKSIHPSGPLYYKESEVDTWKVPQEYDEMFTFKSSNVSATPPDKGNRMNIHEVSVKTAEVKVTFDSKQTKRVVSAEDTSWDGSYFVLEKDFTKQEAVLTLAKEDDGWYVYEMKPLENPFILVTWENPEEGDFGDSQFGFERVTTLKPSRSPEENENPDTPSPSPSSPSNDSPPPIPDDI